MNSINIKRILSPKRLSTQASFAKDLYVRSSSPSSGHYSRGCISRQSTQRSSAVPNVMSQRALIEPQPARPLTRSATFLVLSIKDR